MFQEEKYQERRPVTRDNKNDMNKNNNYRRNTIIIIIIIIIIVGPLSLFVPFTSHVLVITEQEQKSTYVDGR